MVDSDADLKDVYIGLRNLPGIGHLRLGHMKEPLSLEETTSSEYITFLKSLLKKQIFVSILFLGQLE